MLIDFNHGSNFQYRVKAPAMNDIQLSEKQQRAIASIKDWFKMRTDSQQIFRLFGYAGTGKTTVLKYALKELGIENMEHDDDDEPHGGVVTATFTGKAALVLRQKGTPARTIHSLIYSVIEATEEEIKARQEEIDKAKEAALALTDHFESVTKQSEIIGMEEALKKLKQPRFALNPQSDAAFADLIVLDEVSMVGGDMAKDLMSFKRPILVLGDPGQLPPIHGEGAFTNCEPDVMLTEIHRQAEESAIIRLATAARNGQPIEYGTYDAHVAKLPKGSLTAAQMLRGGQVICGMNATRLQLNNEMRLASGFNGNAMPTGNGEKIICLKNMNDRGLINGMFITLTDIEPGDKEHYFSAYVLDEDGNPVSSSSGKQRQRIYTGHFHDHAAFDKDRPDRDWKVKKSLVEATYGWAITCHKAQGSQWENVVVWDDGLGRTDLDRRRWLYTAITRAERGLVLLA
jgi:exodeoxyribonuclease-5